jgi:hypothetical protein
MAKYKRSYICQTDNTQVHPNLKPYPSCCEKSAYGWKQLIMNMNIENFALVFALLRPVAQQMAMYWSKNVVNVVFVITVNAIPR